MICIYQYKWNYHVNVYHFFYSELNYYDQKDSVYHYKTISSS